MSEDTKELLAFSELLVLAPVAIVSYLGLASCIALLYFNWMEPMKAMVVSSVVAGILNGTGFFLVMMGSRFAVKFFQKFKGEGK